MYSERKESPDEMVAWRTGWGWYRDCTYRNVETSTNGQEEWAVTPRKDTAKLGGEDTRPEEGEEEKFKSQLYLSHW
jgi:hypothetical protein